MAVVSSNGNKNCDVGEIPIEYSLTPSGAVSYTIPIDVHPDTEGFQPRLSFMYNSQQHETALGYGWNIRGLSGITHVAGSIYYDGKATPLSLKDDKLMLDGMRLIKTGTDTWQSEQGFIRVNRESENRLKVYYPDGNTAVFENSPQAPFSYVMTSYTNRKGRSILYTYMQADNLPTSGQSGMEKLRGYTMTPLYLITVIYRPVSHVMQMESHLNTANYWKMFLHFTKAISGAISD